MTRKNKIAIAIAVIGSGLLLAGHVTEGALVWVIAAMYAE